MQLALEASAETLPSGQGQGQGQGQVVVVPAATISMPEYSLSS